MKVFSNLAGPAGTITIHDFCLPNEGDAPGKPVPKDTPKSSIFIFSPTAGTAETITSTGPLTQEGGLWHRFALEIGKFKAGDRSGQAFWADRILRTQRVMDAAMASIESGGAKVEVAQ